MGFWSRLLGVDSYDAAQRVLADPYEPFISTGGIPVMDPGSPLEYWTKADVEAFWRSQPNLRKVVGFIARAVASVPLHTHERVSDTERRRVTDHPLPRVLGQPRPQVGPFRFWHDVISDGLLYDRWAVLKDYQRDGSLHLTQIPSWRLRFQVDALRRVVGAKFWVGDTTARDGGDEDWVQLDLDMLIFDHGYAPRTAGLSPVETLKDILDETAEAVRYRRDVWENGGRVDQWIGRGVDAPRWDEPSRNRFVTGLREFRKGGAKSGGIMLLEDGMALNGAPATASSDLLDLDGRQLSAVEVSSAFYIAPELVGAREGNFSNIDAFRQMLYGPSLGPYLTAWEQAINVGLVPDLADGRALYVEANVEAKLRGSFMEQAQIMQSATGAPWLTRNEARSLQNRPPVDGGDELVVPLNVLVGGQASPRDSGSQNLRSRPAATKTAGAVQVKARAPETYEEQATQVLSRFFARQGRVIRSQVGAGSADWWDGERWDGELSADLAGLYVLTATEAGRATLAQLGIDPDEYDEPRTLAFLTEAARRAAASMNETTRAAVEAALADVDEDDEDAPSPSEAVGHVFDVAEESRAAQAALTVVAFASGFGTVEAAQQQATTATKTWTVTSSNPRPSHAAVNGETVGLDEDFSNGLPWPGASGAGPDELAGCTCLLTITIPTPEEG